MGRHAAYSGKQASPRVLRRLRNLRILALLPPAQNSLESKKSGRVWPPAQNSENSKNSTNAGQPLLKVLRTVGLVRVQGLGALRGIPTFLEL